MLTPLLRKLYAGFAAFALVYVGVLVGQYTPWNKERLYRKLVNGGEEARAAAGFDLAYLHGESQLLRGLKSDSADVRFVAANSLWSLWARAGGHSAFRQVEAANKATARKAYPEALKILTGLTRSYPRFAEGWNRRAILFWEMGRLDESIADARRVVTLNPNHFGAWQGMGLCHAQLGDLEEACRCLRAALRITPHDSSLRKLLGRCEELFDRLKPRSKTQFDLI